MCPTISIAECTSRMHLANASSRSRSFRGNRGTASFGRAGRKPELATRAVQVEELAAAMPPNIDCVPKYGRISLTPRAEACMETCATGRPPYFGRRCFKCAQMPGSRGARANDSETARAMVHRCPSLRVRSRRGSPSELPVAPSKAFRTPVRKLCTPSPRALLLTEAASA